jgi:DNA-binding MarR family transcriptional regulator
MEGNSIKATGGYQLSQVCKLRRARGSAMLEKLGIYRGQHFILFHLWEQEGLTHSELAERLHIRPATVTNALKRMERAGLLERRRDTADQRVSRVYLTPEGRAIRSDVEQVWWELEERTFGGLGADDRRDIRRLLEMIRENLVKRSVEP